MFLSPPHLILSSRSHLSSLGSFRSNRFHLYTTDARAKTTFAVGWRTLQVSSSQVKHAWQEDPNSDEGLDHEIDEMAKAVAAKSRPSRTPALQGIPQRFVTVILKVDFLTGLDPQSGFSNKVHFFFQFVTKICVPSTFHYYYFWFGDCYCARIICWILIEIHVTCLINQNNPLHKWV